MAFKIKVKIDCNEVNCDNCRFEHDGKCDFFKKCLIMRGKEVCYRCDECLELERKVTEDCDV